MELRSLGVNGPMVSALGLGCMGMSGVYGPADDQESLATIHAALDAGITLLDTGDFYGMGHNELLVREAIRGRRDKVFLCVKFGPMRSPGGAFIGLDARPSAVKNFLAYSLRRLGTDYVDLYQPARIDPTVPIEDTIGAMQEMIAAGYVRHIGLSEASAQTVRRAHAVHPIAALQIEYSLITRDIEAEVLPVLRALGIGIVAYGVLSRGLLTMDTQASFAGSDIRAHLPRFTGENRKRNLPLSETLKALAKEKGVSAAQLAFAWVLNQGEDIVPLIGARRRSQLEEALGAISIPLSPQERTRMEAAVPALSVAGTRYGHEQMAILNG